MSSIEDDPLYQDPDLVYFYDLACHPRRDFGYCVELAGEASSVLDLGCGTGELAVSLTEGREVTGVDPAGTMLEVARKRPGGENIVWVVADARLVRLDHKFDLIVLTGHAYQVFLSDDDQRAVLATIAAHLNPDGRFVFDTRNPLYRSWQDWSRAGNLRVLDDPKFGAVETWSEASHDAATGIVDYENWYRVLATGKKIGASSKIRYTEQSRLAALIAEAGLVVDSWLGDWEGAAWGADMPEIIPIGRLG